MRLSKNLCAKRPRASGPNPPVRSRGCAGFQASGSETRLQQYLKALFQETRPDGIVGERQRPAIRDDGSIRAPRQVLRHGVAGLRHKSDQNRCDEQLPSDDRLSLSRYDI